MGHEPPPESELNEPPKIPRPLLLAIEKLEGLEDVVGSCDIGPTTEPPLSSQRLGLYSDLKDLFNMSQQPDDTDQEGLHNLGTNLLRSLIEAYKPTMAKKEVLRQIKNQITYIEQGLQRRKDTILLRQNFKSVHERLLQFSRDKNATESFRIFGNRFQNYREAWDCGIDTFHHLLDGHPPKTLKGALGAILVASALASVLDSKKETFGMQDEVVSDLDRWKIAILDRSEKSLFDEISGFLWGKGPTATA